MVSGAQISSGRETRMEARHETVIDVSSPRELSEARLHARSMCELLGIRGYPAQRVVTTVSELARNMIRYVGEGTMRLGLDLDTKRLTIVAEDRGPGIAELESILAGEYQSRTGLGRGLIGVRNLADEFDVQTGPSGTTVTAAFRL